MDVFWDVLWGVWNGATSFGLLVLHVFDVWERFPVYNVGRDCGWYQFGLILGVLMTGGGSDSGAPPQTSRSRPPLSLAPSQRLRARPADITLNTNRHPLPPTGAKPNILP